MSKEHPSNLSHTSNSEQGSDARKPASCSAPRSSYAPTIAPTLPVTAIARPTPWPPCLSNHKMVSLPGGTFLMGTDYPHGFPEDGEGRMRPVEAMEAMGKQRTAEARS